MSKIIALALVAATAATTLVAATPAGATVTKKTTKPAPKPGRF